MDISGPQSVSLDIELDSDIYPTAAVVLNQVCLSNILVNKQNNRQIIHNQLRYCIELTD